MFVQIAANDCLPPFMTSFCDGSIHHNALCIDIRLLLSNDLNTMGCGRICTPIIYECAPTPKSAKRLTFNTIWYYLGTAPTNCLPERIRIRILSGRFLSAAMIGSVFCMLARAHFGCTPSVRPYIQSDRTPEIQERTA